MGVIDNIEDLFKKENWRYTTLLFWLILGMGFIEFFPVAGVFIILPLLAFLVFLLFFSLVSKRDIEDYPSGLVLVLFLIALPFMFLIFTYLVMLWIIAVIVYIFMTMEDGCLK